MNIRWEKSAEISVRIEDDTVVISANREGLLTLADMIGDLSESFSGDHIHLDENNGLNEGSDEVIIEKICAHQAPFMKKKV